MHSVSAELCAQWRNHVREKTTEFVQGIKRTKVSGEASMQNSRQRRALVGTRRAGHRVGTSTLLGDPCSAAASLDPANRSTGGFYRLFRAGSFRAFSPPARTPSHLVTVANHI